MTPSALNLNGESIGQVDIRPPLSVAPEASVREVLRLLKEHRRGSVLVCRQRRGSAADCWPRFLWRGRF
jgi:CBS domain-containing protein